MTATAASAAHTLAATWWRDANTPGAAAPHLVAAWRCSCGATGAVAEGESPKAKMLAALEEHTRHAEGDAALAPEEIVYRFRIPANADRTVTDGNVTVMAYDVEVVRYRTNPPYAQVTGQIVRKSDGLVSSQTRRIVFGNPERAAYLQPIADAPQWVREAYEFVEALA